MTTSPGRGLSIQAGALLGAIAVLTAGCTAAYRGSPPPASRPGAAHGVIAARSSGRGFAHGNDGTAGRGSARHESGFQTVQAPPWARCALPISDPVAHRVAAPPGSRAAAAMCLCCRWCACACAWACCGCGPGRWPPRFHLVWLCCSRWQWPPGRGDSPPPLACRPGCSPGACPMEPPTPVLGPARSAAGPSKITLRAASTAFGARVQARRSSGSGSHVHALVGSSVRLVLAADAPPPG